MLLCYSNSVLVPFNASDVHVQDPFNHLEPMRQHGQTDITLLYACFL